MVLAPIGEKILHGGGAAVREGNARNFLTVGEGVSGKAAARVCASVCPSAPAPIAAAETAARRWSFLCLFSLFRPGILGAIPARVVTRSTFFRRWQFAIRGHTLRPCIAVLGIAAAAKPPPVCVPPCGRVAESGNQLSPVWQCPAVLLILYPFFISLTRQ